MIPQILFFILSFTCLGFSSLEDSKASHSLASPNQASIEIGGTIWLDEDADGIRTMAEDLTLPEGIILTVIDAVTGAPALDANGNLASIQVDSTGLWHFNDNQGNELLPGTYQLRIALDSLWKLSDKDVGLDTEDNDFDPFNLLTDPFTLQDGDSKLDFGAGVWRPVSIGGTIYLDLSSEDYFDPNLDKPRPDIELHLVNAITKQIVQKSFTNEEGEYVFHNVFPNEYYIEIPYYYNTSLRNLWSRDRMVDPMLFVDHDNNFSSPTNGPALSGTLSLLSGRQPDRGFFNMTFDGEFEYPCTTLHPTIFGNYTCFDASRNPLLNPSLFISTCNYLPFVPYANPVDLCVGDRIQNTMWYSFIAGYGDYELGSIVSACFENKGLYFGIEKAQLFNPGCSDNEIIFCSDSPYLLDTIRFSNAINNLEPGQLYIFWMEGVDDDNCTFSIEMTGEFYMFRAPDPKNLFCVGTNDCKNTPVGKEISIMVEANDDPSGQYTPYRDIKDLLFRWSLRDINENNLKDWSSHPQEFGTSIPQIFYTFDSIGDYQICLEEIYHPVSTSNWTKPYCYNISVSDVNTRTDDYLDFDIQISPNPAANVIEIKSTSPFTVSHIIDSKGQMFNADMLSSSSIDITSLPNGVYCVVIHVEGRPITKRFVKIN